MEGAVGGCKPVLFSIPAPASSDAGVEGRLEGQSVGVSQYCLVYLPL